MLITALECRFLKMQNKSKTSLCTSHLNLLQFVDMSTRIASHVERVKPVRRRASNALGPRVSTVADVERSRRYESGLEGRLPAVPNLIKCEIWKSLQTPVLFQGRISKRAISYVCLSSCFASSRLKGRLAGTDFKVQRTM